MIDWSKIRWFSPEENWGDIFKIHPQLVELLDRMREYAGRPIIIHEAYATSGHSPNSYHYLGMAADCHIKGLNVIDQYLIAERFPWGGIGVYGRDVWNRPGLHVDVRPGHARWGCMKVEGKRKYVPLNAEFIEHLVKLEEQ